MKISIIKSYNIFLIKNSFGPVEQSIEKQDEEQTHFLLQKFDSQLNIV